MKLKSTREIQALPEDSIVCGMDFSPPACESADVANGIARRLGVPLALAHTVEMPGSIASDKENVAWWTAKRFEQGAAWFRRRRGDGEDTPAVVHRTSFAAVRGAV